jgi:DNA-binding CsgD family transcriptional regulator
MVITNHQICLQWLKYLPHLEDLIENSCAMRKGEREFLSCDTKDEQMLVARKDKSTSGPRYSGRLDMPNVVYALANPMKATREEQILNFLKESLMLAKKAHHVENFIQNLYLRCPNSWGLYGICLRKISSTNRLTIVTQISNHDIPLKENIRITVDSKAPELEAIRFNVGIFFETRSALLNYSDEGAEICNNNSEIQGLVCLPITSEDEIWGTLEFLFDKEVECDEGIQDFFSCVAQIVGVAIDHTSSTELKVTGQKDLDAETEKELADMKLTPKLKKIAAMISEGKTNTEIARALSYSESAARYETVKLYAMLRVKNRAEAGAAINRLNLTQ